MKRKKLPEVSFYDIEKHCIGKEYYQADEDIDFVAAINTIEQISYHQKYEFCKEKPHEKKEKKAIPCKKIVITQTIEKKKTQYRDVLCSERICFDRRLDMHGLVVRTAYTTLLSFIQSSYNNQLSTLLVITGKGKNSVGNIPVLREHVCAWLVEYPFHEVVESFSLAHKKHGGEGAIAILLRPYNKNRIIRWDIPSFTINFL